MAKFFLVILNGLLSILTFNYRNLVFVDRLQVYLKIVKKSTMLFLEYVNITLTIGEAQARLHAVNYKSSWLRREIM